MGQNFQNTTPTLVVSFPTKDLILDTDCVANGKMKKGTKNNYAHGEQLIT